MKKTSLRVLILLHLLVMGYSFSGVFTKLASNAQFPSIKFIICYGMVIFILGIYAIGWQQIIKRMPLTTAFSNKAVTVVWGIIWGAIFFSEGITFGKIVGATLVIAGVILFVIADSEDIKEGKDE